MAIVMTNKRERNPEYLAYIRRQWCCVPGCTSRSIVAHHVKAGGMGTKCPDTITAPLCAYGHHEELHQHGKKTFEAKYGINLLAIAERLNNQYQLQEDRKGDL